MTHNKFVNGGTNADRQLRGYQSRVAGETFEGIIMASLDWYRDRGEADIEKTPEPMKPLRAPNSKGQFLACYTKAAQPDFKGTLAGGRSVVFEAKHTDTGKAEQRIVSEEQTKRLTSHSRLGAVSFVLVSFGLPDVYRVPWDVWQNMKALYGRKYLKPSDIEEYRVPYMAGVIKLLNGIDGREVKP